MDLLVLAADHLPRRVHRDVHLPAAAEHRVLVDAVPEDLLPDPCARKTTAGSDAMSARGRRSPLRTRALVPAPGRPRRRGWCGRSGELNVRESHLHDPAHASGRAGRAAVLRLRARPLPYEPNNVATLRLIQEESSRRSIRWEPRVRVDDVRVASTRPIHVRSTSPSPTRSSRPVSASGCSSASAAPASWRHRDHPHPGARRPLPSPSSSARCAHGCRCTRRSGPTSTRATPASRSWSCSRS